MGAREFRLDVPDPEYIGTDEDAEDLLRLLLRKIESEPEEFIGFDTETHGKKLPISNSPLDPMTDTVTVWSLAAGFGQGEERYYRRWCLGSEYFAYFAPLLEHRLLNIAGWNIKYDGHVAWNCGVNIWNARRPVCGTVLAKLHDENRRSHGLKQCAADWCGIHMTPYKSLFKGVVDSEGKQVKEFVTNLVELIQLGHADKVSNYASYDAYAHLRVVEWLRDRLMATPIDSKGYSLWDYFLEIEMHVTRMIWFMEKRGMRIDTEYLLGLIPSVEKRVEAIEKEVCRIRGAYINLASPKQLAQFFFTKEGLGLKPLKLTETGQPSTDEEVLEILKEAGHEVAGKILEVRKLNKVKSTYMDSLVTLANYYEDKRIHPSFNQLGARTGRFSVQYPNSENMPRPDTDEWGIRKAFIARDGYILLVADYEQIEMRIMADRSNDRKMIDAIKSGKDIHSFTVSLMVPGVTYEEVVAAKKAEHPTDRQKWLKLKRQNNKAVGFGIIYGAGPPKISESIEISEADWHEALDTMEPETFERRLKRTMKNNPLLTLEKATEQVGRFSVAGDRIQDYLNAFPGVKGFMEATPDRCRGTIYNEPDGRPKHWDFVLNRNGWGNAIPLSESGHAARFGYVKTLRGRYRRLEDIDHSNYMFKSEASRQAVNTRIQGSAADITIAAMLKIEKDSLCRALGVQILNQVHDEIVMEVPIENAEEAAERVKEIMENPDGPEHPMLCVPIPVELKIVERWSDAK